MVFRRCDLSDLASLKVLAIDLGKELDHIDILVNNAGLISTELKKTKQGLEMTIGSNFVGPMYLTHLLMPLLKKAKEARIMNVSSLGYKLAMKLKQDDEGFLLRSLKPEEYSAFFVYTKSKLGNVYFTTKLAELLEKSGQSNIKTVIVHPGTVRSAISRDFSTLLKLFYTLTMPIWYITLKSPAEGSQTSLACSCQPFDKLYNGAYYAECRPEPVADVGRDVGRRDRVWRMAVDVVGELTGDVMYSDIDN